MSERLMNLGFGSSMIVMLGFLFLYGPIYDKVVKPIGPRFERRIEIYKIEALHKPGSFRLTWRDIDGRVLKTRLEMRKGDRIVPDLDPEKQMYADMVAHWHWFRNVVDQATVHLHTMEEIEPPSD